MSWLTRAWDHNRNTIGRGVERLAPALAFTPLGIPGAAIASGLGRAAQKGTNIGDIGWATGRGALYGGAAKGAQGLLSGLGGSPAGASSTASTTSAAPTTSPGFFAGTQPYTMPSGGSAGGVGGAVSSLGSLGSRVASALGSAGNFAKANALPIGQAASGILNAREQGQQNAIQQQHFSFEQRQYEDEQERRRKIAQLLAPLYQQMMAQQGTLGAPPWRG